MSLSKSIIHGSLWSVSGVFIDKIFGFVVFLLLARLLSPEEFGIAALSLVFIEIAQVIARCGITDAIVKSKRIFPFMADTAFITSISIGMIFTCFFFLMSPVAGLIYKSEQIEDIIKLMSLIFVINSLGMVHEGLITKTFGFKSLAVRNFTGTLIGGIVAIILAFNGYGVWALVIQRLIITLWNTIIVWVSHPYRPQCRFSKKASLHMIKFGAGVMSSNFIWVLNARLHELIIGYFLSPQAVGYFRIAWRGLEMVIELTLRPISRVAYASFAKLQSNPEKFTRMYSYFILVSSLITFPVFIGSSIVAPELVTTIFGSQWTMSGEIMQILCLLVVPTTLNIFIGSALGATGHPIQMNKLAIIYLIVNGICTLIGVQYGLKTVATLHVISSYLILPYACYLVSKYSYANIILNLKSIVIPSVATLIMAVSLIIINSYMLDNVSTLIRLFTIIVTGALIYGVITICLARKYLGHFFVSLSESLPPRLAKMTSYLFITK